MSDNAQMDAIKRYARLIEKQTGKAVRPYRMDGYVNLMNRYGTSKDPSEHYSFQREPDIPDDVLTTIYEGNGLFAKIIDTPAEEAIKHGFTLKDVSDKAVEEFVTEALDELDWEELAMTAIRWTRLFGGAIAVMLINDGGRLEDPLNWRKIKSIDDIRVYERVVVQPEYESMFNYDPTDPFSTRGSRLGMPEYYQVCSRYGNFRVHDSRCLVFQNGVLPENATNSLYRLWGIPEYIRIHRALKDAELAHESAPKLLDRSVQAIYKMKGLSQLMATEQGESQVLRRLQVIDMARGMLNSLVIDSEGEDYDFKTFQFNGITDVVSASCNMLSAITSIPQTILFGQGVGGLSTTDDTSMENYYNYIERIQKRMLRKNLRYLLSIIFQAGLYTGEVDEVPKLNVEFNPLWSLNDTEQATLEQQKAATELTKAQTAQAYIQMEAIDPSEVRKGLADSDEFDVETLLDELDDGEEDLFSNMPDMEGGAGSQNPPESETGPQKIFEQGHFADYAEGVDVKEHDTDPGKNGSPTPASAPAATKLPQDMSDEEKLKAAEAPTNPDKKPAINAQGDGNTTSLPDDEKAGVGVLVLKEGKVLVGTRESESGYGLICGPGGHIKVGETPTQAAFRETEEEFGISPTELIPIGRGPAEPDTGIKPYVFLCTEYHGDLHCVDGEMKDPKFLSLDEIEQLKPSLFQPFSDGVDVLKAIINNDDPDPDGPDHDDGGEGSGNFNHKGRPGEVGGSAESHQLGGLKNGELSSKMKSVLSGAKVGTHFSVQVNGPAGKEAYEVYKTTDGYYLRGKNGSNRACPTDVDAVEHLGVYVNERTENKVMYNQADIQIGEPETDEAKKFTSDYEVFKKSKERLQSGEAQFAEVSDDVAKQYADTLNKASKSKIVKMAEQDPAFKEIVDNISAYTQGEYVFQRKVAEGVINNGYDAGKDQILGDRLTDSLFTCKDMYKGQNLSVSSASVAEGMANLTKAVNKSEPFEGEIYRVAQDTGIYSYASDGNQSVYVPPAVGETIKITAPTSFSKDQGAVDKIAKNKSGDIIYYTVEPGAHAVDVSKLSPYKQAELLSCGEYEVVKVESENRTYLGETTDKYTQEVLETLQKTRGATVSNGYIKVPVLTTHITLRQKETGNTDSADDDTRYYRPDDFCDRMILDGGHGSGNFGHEGRPGEIGGSAQSSATVSKETANSLIQKVNTSKSGTVIQISANGNGLFRDNGDTAELRVVRNKHSVEKLVDINTGKEYTTADVLMQVVQSQSNDFDLLSDESQCPQSVDAYSGGKDAFAEEAFSKERKKNAQKCYGAVESEIAYGDVAKSVAENASPEQKYAAFMYMANSSSINGMLRGERLNSNLEEMCKKTSDDLASLIEKSSYNSDIYVQRGITAKGLSAMLGCDESAISTSDEDALKKTAVGTEYTENAFTSAGAAMGTGLTDRDVQMSIYCPKGTKMLYMNKAVGADDEAQNEMLLQKGTSYKVTGIKRLNDGKIMVDAEVIGQAEDSHNGDGWSGSGNFGHEGRSGEQVFYDEKDE